MGDNVSAAHLTTFRGKDVTMSDYRTLLEAANADPAAFWGTRAETIDWFKPWDAALSDLGDPVPRWFAAGKPILAITAWTGM